MSSKIWNTVCIIIYILAVDVFVDGKSETVDWSVGLDTPGGISFYNDSGDYVMAYPNGVVTKITINFELEMMTFGAIVGPALQGKIEGLLGE